MRVGIDATCWSNRRGYGRFTRGLIDALLKVNKEHEILLFVDDHTHKNDNLPEGAQCIVVPTSQAPTKAASASSSRSLSDLWAMANAVMHCKLDTFFFPSVYTYFPALTGASIILGVHDVIAEDYPQLVFPDKKHRKLWEIKGWFAHRQADYIMTVSEHAKGGIIRHFGHSPDKVFVIDEAPDAVFRRLSPAELNRDLLSKFGLLSTRFFLYLGGVNPHKNLVALVESLAEVRQDEQFQDVKLVIVGDVKDGFTPGLDELRKRIETLGLNDSVIFTGYISDEDAVHFYNTAMAVVLPSFAEGFGLPAIEGAACGVPVIATRNSPLPDLLSGGGLFIQPERKEQLTQALFDIVRDEVERHNMGQVARQKALQLTWQRSAEQMQTMLERVAQNR